METNEVVTPGQQEVQEPTKREVKAEVNKAKARVRKAKPAEPFKTGESGVLSKEQRRHVKVVVDEADPLFNPKVRDPEDMSSTLAQLGWLSTNPLAVLSDGRIVSGRTKWLSLEKAEKRVDHEIAVPYIVVDMDEEVGADATDALDIRVQKLNPMIIAEKVFRSLSRGKTEKEIFDLTGINPEQQHGYLLLLDEDKCPTEVQKMLRGGLISFAAALELARQADKLSKSEVRAAAEQLARAAAGGVRATTGAVKRAAGDSDGPATLKQKKQFLLDLQSDILNGKHGEAATWAAIVALELGLGTRTIESTRAALKKIAKGETVRVDFKQYQDGSKK